LWIFLEYNEDRETISLNSISFQITMADIYNKVEFEAQEKSFQPIVISYMLENKEQLEKHSSFL